MIKQLGKNLVMGEQGMVVAGRSWGAPAGPETGCLSWPLSIAGHALAFGSVGTHAATALCNVLGTGDMHQHLTGYCWCAAGNLDLLKVSLPVRMFEPRSYLQKLTDPWVCLGNCTQETSASI